MDCPRCDGALVEGHAGDLTALGCPVCGGVWLNNVDSQRVVDGLSADSLDAVRALSEKAEEDVDTTGADLHCPSCNEALSRQRVARAWLDVDICATHGTWFDAGEIERIAAAMNKPLPRDWRQKTTVASGPAPKPMQRLAADEVEHMDMRSPYARGFGQILRSLWRTLTDSSQYATEGEYEIDIGGVSISWDAD